MIYLRGEFIEEFGELADEALPGPQVNQEDDDDDDFDDVQQEVGVGDEFVQDASGPPWNGGVNEVGGEPPQFQVRGSPCPYLPPICCPTSRLGSSQP